MSCFTVLFCALSACALTVQAKPHQCYLEEYSNALLNAIIGQQGSYPSYYELDDINKRLGRSNELQDAQKQPCNQMADYFAFNPLRSAAPAPALATVNTTATAALGKGVNDTVASAAADVAKYYEQIKTQQEILAQQQLQQQLYQEQQRKQQEYMLLQQQLQQQYYQQQQALLMLEQLNKNPAFVDQFATYSKLGKAVVSGNTEIPAVAPTSTSASEIKSDTVKDTTPVVEEVKKSEEYLDADKPKPLNTIGSLAISNKLEKEKRDSAKTIKFVKPRDTDEEVDSFSFDSSEEDSQEPIIEKVYAVTTPSDME